MKRLLLIHNEVERLDALIKEFESRGWEVAALSVLNLSVNQLQVGRYSLIILHEDDKDKVKDFVKELKGNPLTAHVPLFGIVRESNMRSALRGELLGNVDETVPDTGTASEAAETIETVFNNRNENIYDSVTGLLTGAPLMKCISAMCQKFPRDWHFITMKLLELKPYNHHYGYDRGDNLIRAVGQAISEEVRENGEPDDIAGRLSGDRFCIITQSRRVEGMCRKIRLKSERSIRKFYTPFELTKGVISVEGKSGTKDFDLSDLKVAAVNIPANWDENMAYLMDVTKDLISVLEHNDKGYVIYKV